MHFIFTRRKYDPASDTFTKDIADESSFVVLPHEGRNAGDKVAKSDWLAAIRSQITTDGIVIFVHGYNTGQFEMLTRLRKLQRGLTAIGNSATLVAFSWPTREHWSKYNEDHANVPIFAPSLLHDGIAPLLALPEQPKVSVICHSMGSYVFLMGLSGATSPRQLDQVAFAAGDLDRPWFDPGAQGARLVGNWSKRFTNYYSSKDRILDLSERVIHGDPRVGGDGMPNVLQTGLVDVDCTFRYLSPVHKDHWSRNYSHRFYFDDDVWLRDFAMTMDGRQADGRGPSSVPTDSMLLP